MPTIFRVLPVTDPCPKCGKNQSVKGGPCYTCRDERYQRLKEL